MTNSIETNATSANSGVDAFIGDTCRLAAQADPNRAGTVRFVLNMGEDFAFIRLSDLWRPLRFLKQMASVPPVRFGTEGFRVEVVDDLNPARHYTAFVFVGFWLPTLLAICVLWLWEIAGFVRYKGHWSPGDIRSGNIGIRHGRLVHRYGPTVLPALIAAELAER